MIFHPLGDVLGAQLVRHQRQDGPALALLRLRQRSQVVALVGHHLGEADADRPDGRHQRLGGFLGPAVGGLEDLLDPLLRLRLGGRAAR